MPSKRVRIQWKGETGQAYSLEIDATTNEQHDASNTITEHPVEKGVSIADHIRPEPDLLTTQGVISNTPIFLPKDHVDGAKQTVVEVEGVAPSVRVPLPVVGSLVGNISIAPTPKGHVMGFDPAFDRVAACYEALLEIRNKGILATVITTLRQYENMGMVSLAVTREAASGNSLQFTIQWKQVRFGATENVPVPKIPRNKKDKGTKVPEAAEPDTERASALFNAFG